MTMRGDSIVSEIPTAGSDRSKGKQKAQGMPVISQDIHPHGFVSLERYMGDDKLIAQSARMLRGSLLDRTDPNQGLLDTIQVIEHLLDHSLTEPFRMVSLQFHMKVPVFLLERFTEFGICVENSAKYNALAAEECWTSVAFTEVEAKQWDECFKECFRLYEKLVRGNVSSQIARAILPQSAYREIRWSIHGEELLAFFHHVEQEGFDVGEYEQAIRTMSKRVIPVTIREWEARNL